MRRLYIILAIFVVIILGAVSYLVFFRGSTQPGTGTAPTGSTGSLPSAGGAGGGAGTGGNGGAGSQTGSGAGAGNLPAAGGVQGSTSFGVVSDQPAIDYFVDVKNNVTIIAPNGEIKSVAGGTTKSLNAAGAENILASGFAYNGTKLLVNFGDRTNPQTSVFDVSSTAWTPLGLGIISPVWSPSDMRIAYLKNNSDGSATLSTLDLSKATNKPVALVTVHAEDVTLAWPNKNQIMLSDKGSAYEEGSPLVYDLVQKTLLRPMAAVHGFAAIWSNTTNTAALTFSSGAAARGGDLSLWTNNLSSSESLTILTLPSKCVFNSVVGVASAGTSTPAAAPYLALYCAIPQNASALSSAVLPDDYNQQALFTVDSLYKIRTDNGDVQTLLTPAQAVDATNLKVFGKTLFFINRYDNKVYALSLGA